MGCQQSKAVQSQLSADPKNEGAVRTAPASPASLASIRSVTIPPEINKISNPGQRLYRLLEVALEQNSYDELIWTKAVKICDKFANAVNYQHPKSGDTPLHIACRILSLFPYEETLNVVTPLDAMRVFIRCSADIVSRTNGQGYIALHDALNVSPNASPVAIQHQTQIVNLLIAADYETSVEYLQRTNVVYNRSDGAGTPLYHAVARIPDDFSAPPGPTIHFISAIHFPCPNMVSAKNDSNYDKPLSLLYRRFSRQFDQSEKFFPGDNSRREVVEHRNKYKIAAMNTWKIILALLDPLLDKKKAVSDFYMVHAAVNIDCPPDLLRYIIETRPEEVRKANEKKRLPLHVAADAKVGNVSSSISSTSKYHYKFVIDELLYSYPDGAACIDADNMLPLQLAVNSGKTWIGGGTKSLYDVYPDAMARIPVDNFPTLKSALSFSTNYAEEREEELKKNKDRFENGVVKEEHYDAIMMVQKPDADLGDIISAMWANEEDGGVQMLGCVAIANIANKTTSKSKLRSVALTSVTTVVNAMKNHPNEPAVQEKGCIALGLLSPADHYREISFSASGAVASIVAAMQAHVSDVIVQQEASAALCNIVKNGGPERATVVASVSGFTALQNALGTHPKNLGVQREACMALEALTQYQGANLPDLPGVQMAPLLEAARNRFPKECGDIAGVVLSRLS
mmetsp:Transcript_4389/g.8440  ORF Transcript_4389/g.8440 Transcript_4389/m.8440 type:complete len:684 (-) Transcript_4389:172-2223(-)|eukprot:CAMPEP_0176494202 /NCGR_PEP_ID=MMETSP0200_2-20121128/9957_1 /TAXON_ID=947934 /ORGANISM="Chaetoceros sp., Strain GSL56" /LENGTH=683 /DNA_ID=CAMNT_0017891917 /DNA_START=146 /DNA_END=2197 /DNA_ORIENTATION=-